MQSTLRLGELSLVDHQRHQNFHIFFNLGKCRLCFLLEIKAIHRKFIF